MNVQAVFSKFNVIKNTISLLQTNRLHCHCRCQYSISNSTVFRKCLEIKSLSKFCTFSHNSSPKINKRESDTNNHNIVEPSRFQNLLEAHFYGVEQCGKLDIKIPFNLAIESLDPQAYPEMNKAKISVFYIGDDKNSISSDKLLSFTKMYDLNIELMDKTSMVVSATGTIENLPLSCLIQLPLQFDLQIQNEGDLQVSNMESSSIDIDNGKSLGGVCLLKNTKTEKTTVSWRNGDIICKKVLQGNLSLSNSGTGGILADKLQGQNIKCETEAGKIDIGSVYSEGCSFITQSADIKLGNCHGSCQVQVGQGNVHMNSVDGDLSSDIQNGSIKAHLSRPGQINIWCKKGDVELEVPDDSAATVSLEGNIVECDEKLIIQNKEERSTELGMKCTGYLSSSNDVTSICAKTDQGKVRLLCRDWLASISEKFQPEK